MRQIRKELMINAPVAKVWEHLTDPARIAGWFMPTDFKPEAGSPFVLNSHCSGQVSCVVKEVVPQRKLVYTFKPPQLSSESLVTFLLEEIDRTTRLTLIHSGFEKLKPEETGIIDEFDQGWEGHFLKRLKALLEDGK